MANVFPVERLPLPDCKGIVPCFEEEANWTPRQHELFGRLNTALGTCDSLAQCCAQYLHCVMHRREDQMQLVKCGAKFRTELEDVGFDESDIRAILLYARRHNSNGGKHTGWGPSV